MDNKDLNKEWHRIATKAQRALVRREGKSLEYSFCRQEGRRGKEDEYTVTSSCTGSWVRGYEDKTTGKFIVTFYGHA